MSLGHQWYQKSRNWENTHTHRWSKPKGYRGQMQTQPLALIHSDVKKWVNIKVYEGQLTNPSYRRMSNTNAMCKPYVVAICWEGMRTQEMNTSKKTSGQTELNFKRASHLDSRKPWRDMARMVLSFCSFPPLNHNPGLTMKKNIQQISSEGDSILYLTSILQNCQGHQKKGKVQ